MSFEARTEAERPIETQTAHDEPRSGIAVHAAPVIQEGGDGAPGTIITNRTCRL
jgi:hypothetical protein